MKTYKNRYGVIYWFEQVKENVYTIKGDLHHWRFGGKIGQENINLNDLSFVDPSGGPFLSEGKTIEGKVITRIYIDKENGVFFEVQNNDVPSS